MFEQWDDSTKTIRLLALDFYAVVQGVPKKRLPLEFKCYCCMFEFECLNSLMSLRMRKSIRNACIRIFSSNI